MKNPLDNDPFFQALTEMMDSNPVTYFENNELSRELVHYTEDGKVYCSVELMTERELLESIVGDLLNATMLEKEHKCTVNLDADGLVKFLPSGLHASVIQHLNHPDIAGLVRNSAGQLRIRDDREILQAAMDFCGHWYEGYTIPGLVEEAGEVGEPVDRAELEIKLMSVYMDLQGNSPCTTTIH